MDCLLHQMHNAASKTDALKKKSRYYRRKPKNLLEEYTRRQRKHVWLETHIWHAKRMKMIDAWGYRLADHPNDKGFRAAYRASKNNCILQVLIVYLARVAFLFLAANKIVSSHSASHLLILRIICHSVTVCCT